MRWALIAAIAVHACTATTTRVKPSATEDDQLWLEEIEGEEALAWVAERNAESVAALEQDPVFTATRDRLLAIYDSDAKIPYVNKIGDHYYNFWRDAEHERGVWRRTTLQEYRKAAPAWETVLDLDALSAKEETPWVWHGADCLYPEYRLCLVELSDGGKDADITREFDLTTKAFVEGGFYRPESKGQLSWIDRDRVYAFTDFGEGSLTESGYPRIAKEWRRGTPMSEAVTVYEGQATDMYVAAFHDHTPGYERDGVIRVITFYSNQLFQRTESGLTKVEKPDDANAVVHRDLLLLELRSDWQVGERTFPAGALVAADFDAFMAGERDLEMLFEPGERTSLQSFSATRSAILLTVLDEVKGRLHIARRFDGAFEIEPLPGLPEIGTIRAWAEDDIDSDAFFITVDNLLTPTRLARGAVPAARQPLTEPEELKRLPAFFDAENLVAHQYQATSKDGTRVPYFVVHRADLDPDGQAPTLMYGYGGFEVPILPDYVATYGAAWLEKGGVYVQTNIRGGGEFGPRWHQAALRDNRQRAFDDFIGVAEDLVQRKITSPPRLGIVGGSNGGLLVGNMLVQRPDLFGAIICAVPLLDMLRYHELLAGASWIAEYGDPSKPGDRDFLLRYSPYHEVRADVDYPPTFFFTSTRDDRVHPGHARKMVARLRAQGHEGMLYFENTEGGHAGAATNKQRARMWAQAYTFLWQTIGP